eukprot:scaffold445527_cov47-Prasinocladus_malaysianus.AAC.3
MTGAMLAGGLCPLRLRLVPPAVPWPAPGPEPERGLAPAPVPSGPAASSSRPSWRGRRWRLLGASADFVGPAGDGAVQLPAEPVGGSQSQGWA